MLAPLSMTTPTTHLVNSDRAHQSASDAEYQARLLRAIPGGAHTYSRGSDQFPSNAPSIFTHGEGVYAYTPDGRRYLDFAMALGAVNIGYGEPCIVNAALQGMKQGNGLSRPSMIELEAAEKLIELVPSIDMVKFTKNGSTAVTAAVKLARAFTGRELVARCAQHPFFSYDDWFIGSTPVTRGITRGTISETLTFNYNDIESLERLLTQHKGKFAAVVLEPATLVCPNVCGQGPCQGPITGCCSAKACTARAPNCKNFLHEVRELCDRHGVVMVLDEMISGFRWDLRGAQHLLDVRPDITTFGKAMANGFSVACVGGRRDIMQLGAIEFAGTERVFLLSTTHGAEMCGLSAFLATVEFMQKNNVCEHLWNWGARFVQIFNRAAQGVGVSNRIKAGGPACKPGFLTLDEKGQPCMALRTLFMQEMLKHNILMPQVVVAYRHGEAELQLVERALAETMPVIAKALRDGLENYIEGPLVKPVFRKLN